ncbi:hypothetical protein HXX76_003864 [Chlamydomonas incerta]|uniref:Uncharacterized protein n=1 Tax=Chlamydomonas incerta TaxID=51695 RepID=A0A835W984_CHLIN|nr:hypothetical protein HXX76_003864 [Chlamydomonas incerta]|eukprot:KAG2441011.1 hypothetical protein HXX76_003864 [Chlamydomonas incerta]
MPGWSPGQACAVLMTLALLRRRPDDEWLSEFYALTAARLGECSEAELAMLSYGLSELALTPPQPWGEALLASALALAEAAAPAAAAAAALPPLGAAEELEVLATAAAAAAPLRHRAQVRPLLSGPGAAAAAAATAAGEEDGLAVLTATLKSLVGAGGLGAAPAASRRLSPVYTASPPTPHPSAATSVDGAAASLAAAPGADGTDQPLVRPINSAYDLEDVVYGTSSREGRSSAIAELLLEPAAALWGGVRRAASAVTASARRQRAGSELVTVVYNLTAAGVRVEPTWLGRFLEAMGPRLRDLSGCDLRCLLLVAAEACGPDVLCPEPPSRAWQAHLYSRMDGVNWSLQGRNLVGCLDSIATLGLRPPAPWVRRQLSALQPSLPALPNSCLVQLAPLLTALPLPHPTAATSAAASSDGSSSSSSSRKWFDVWVSDYRTVVWERRNSLTAAGLLSIMTGVAAVMPGQLTALPSAAGIPAAAAAAATSDAKSLLRSRASVMSYTEWRVQMSAAVAALLPGSSLVELCEAWQALAEAETQVAEAQGDVSGSGGPALAKEVYELRELVSAWLAQSSKSQLAASDVPHVLSSLAAAGAHVPGPALAALVAASEPLLGALSCGELVTVALSLVRLAYRPNMAWQAAFCAASRRRLGLMTAPQRASLLVAAASLGLHLPQPWLHDFFAVSLAPGAGGSSSSSAATGSSSAAGGPAAHLGDGGALDGTQLANVLWAVSCVAPEPPPSWLSAWEYASMPRLRELGPNMLAVVLKAMSTLHYRPSRAWQSAYFAAVRRRLFAAGAAQLRWPTAVSTHSTAPSAAASLDLEPLPATTAAAGASSATAAAAAASTASQSGIESPAASAAADDDSVDASSAWMDTADSTPTTSSAATTSGSGRTGLNMLSTSVTPESLNSIVYSLASLDLDPPAAWLDELMDAVRCKLSMLSTLDLSVVLAFLVARNHRPSDDWWESFLEALQSRFESLSAIEMASQLIMLNALKVSPTAEWLDGFCDATQARLTAFGPSHLLQVLSCLHLFRHRPSQAWMGAYMAAVEAALGRFTATELARVLMLLDHLNQRPSAAFMRRFYDVSVPGLAGLEPQELVNCAWAAVSCSSVHPDACWTDALVVAARPRVSALSQPQLRVLVAALGHMQRSTPTAAAADFLAFAREFLVV